MRKVYKLLVFFGFIFSFLFVSVVAFAQTPSMQNGAQIRTTGKQGLMFTATVDTLENTSEHGFYVAIGNHSVDSIQAAVDADQTTVGENVLKKVVVEGENTTFKVVVYNIGEAYYEQSITAVAYVVTEEETVLSETAVTRSIGQVARGLYNDDNGVASFIFDIAKKGAIKVDGLTKTKYYQSLSEVQFEDGDTITLPKGTYNDNFTINANNVTIQGPNAEKAGTANDREEEAVLTGVVTLNGNGATLKGLKFENQARLVSSTSLENIKVLNNKFISKITDNIITFTGSSYYTDLNISNNYFELSEEVEFVEETKFIYLFDLANFTFNNNSFNNIKNEYVLYIHDELLGLSGLNNSLSNNTFTDITGTAIHVDWYGSDASIYKNGVFNFNNNIFENVGKGIVLNGCNNSSVLESLSISENEFTNTDTCVVVKRLPGNGSKLSINTLKIKDNVFYTVPSTAYFDFTQNASTNYTGICNVSENDYVCEATPDQSNKFINVKMFEYDAVVDDSYSSLSVGEKVEINGVTYTLGASAFSSVSSALNVVAEGKVIYVASGTYNENIEITKSVTLKGANYNLLGGDSRIDETIINGTVTLGANNITIEGFKFINESSLVSVVGYSNYFTLRNNYLYTTIGNKVIDFSVDTNSTYNYYAKPVFEGNKFEFVGTSSGTGTGYIAFSDVDSIQLLNNEFVNLPFDALHIDDGDGAGLRDNIGSINMNNNTFSNIGGSAIMVKYYFFMGTVSIKDNTFENIANYCINLGNDGVSSKQGAASIVLTGNIFNGSNNKLIFIKKVLASMTVTATDNVFNSVPTNYYFNVETNNSTINVSDNTYNNVSDDISSKFINVTYSTLE